MFEGWTWQKFVGKFLLLGVAIVEVVIAQLGVAIPYWMIIGTGATWLAQFVIGWLPGMVWQAIVGKALILFGSVVSLILSELGVEIAVWAVIAPMITALAQYFIGLAPKEE